MSIFIYLFEKRVHGHGTGDIGTSLLHAPALVLVTDRHREVSPIGTPPQPIDASDLHKTPPSSSPRQQSPQQYPYNARQHEQQSHHQIVAALLVHQVPQLHLAHIRPGREHPCVPQRANRHDHDLGRRHEFGIHRSRMGLIDDVDWRFLVDAVPQIDLAAANDVTRQ